MGLRQSLVQVGECLWELPRQGAMRVPGLIVAGEEMLDQIFSDDAPQQVVNMASLPGILGHAVAMPDIHWGYGFPIGGVIATDVDTGVISPGGVGFDINCGVRLLRTDLSIGDLRRRIPALVASLFRNIPCGVGSHGLITLTDKELIQVLRQGAQWAVHAGYGWDDDILCIEDEGKLSGANPAAVSDRALQRGRDQLGTLGSGNHFLEIQYIEEIYDTTAAAVLQIDVGQLVVMIHCGSRGLGYQVCDDYVRQMLQQQSHFGITLPDRQLACAPLSSTVGKHYLGAMRAAANFAYANRQCISHWVRRSFEEVLETPAERLGMHLLYDVTHNTAKIEKHRIDGKLRDVCVHRKGATRSLPSGRDDIPAAYRAIGQPVMVPGDMGRCSYLMLGQPAALEYTFGSTCHGAGRLMSRRKAVKQTRGRDLVQEMQDRGITVMSKSKRTLREECPEAYKDVTAVVSVVDRAGLSSKVAKLLPVGVVKG